jgi:hypothetical protein
MIDLVLSLALMLGGGDATWYGEDGRCYDGHWKTCSPYLSKKDGGRGGELVMYAAVGSWKWGDKPYRVNVCRPANGRCVTVWVRDFCRACKNKFGVIDLSPAAFRKLAPLYKGRIKVVVSEYREEYVRGR